MGKEMGNNNSSDQREEDNTKMEVKDVVDGENLTVSLIPEMEPFPEKRSGLSSDEAKKEVVEDPLLTMEISSQIEERQLHPPEYYEITMKSSESISENGEEQYFVSDMEAEPKLKDDLQETSEYQQVSIKKEEGNSELNSVSWRFDSPPLVFDLKLERHELDDEQLLCNELPRQEDASRLSFEPVIEKSGYFTESEKLNKLDVNCSAGVKGGEDDLSVQKKNLCNEKITSMEEVGNDLKVTINGEVDGLPNEVNLDEINSSESQPEAIIISLKKLPLYSEKVSESGNISEEKFSAAGKDINGGISAQVPRDLVNEAQSDETDAFRSESQMTDTKNDNNEKEKLFSPDSEDWRNNQIESSEDEQKLEVEKDIQIDQQDSVSAANKQIQASEEWSVENYQFHTHLSKLGVEDYNKHKEEKLEEKKTEEALQYLFSQQLETSTKIESVQNKKESISELEQSPGEFSVFEDSTFNCTNLTAKFPISEVHSAMEMEKNGVIRSQLLRPSTMASTDSEISANLSSEEEDGSKILALADCIHVEQERLARFSTESNPEINSNSRAQMRKSPSFNINLRSHKSPEELDPTPLLCEEKSATEASIEKNIITLENPNREKSTPPLSRFLEEDKETQFAVATQNQGDSSSAQITNPINSEVFDGEGKVASTPSKRRRNQKYRSSIFANCLCCATTGIS